MTVSRRGSATKLGSPCSARVHSRTSAAATPLITRVQAVASAGGTSSTCSSGSPNRSSPFVVIHSPRSPADCGTSTQRTSTIRPSASGSDRTAAAGSRICGVNMSTSVPPVSSASPAATPRACHSCAGGHPGRNTAWQTTTCVASSSFRNWAGDAPKTSRNVTGSGGASPIADLVTLSSGPASIRSAPTRRGSGSRCAASRAAAWTSTGGRDVTTT